MASRGHRLRALLRRPEIAVIPGAGTALHAKLVEAAGFEAVYMTGYGTSLSLLGLPDMGLATMTEMALNAGYMAQAVDIPLLVDGDTGHGNALNVQRTVQAFIRAGVAGVHLEDQVSPKRCGGVAGREVIPVAEMVGKLRAALEAREALDPEFVVVARTDALGAANGGLEEAIRRGQAYLEAGADAVMTADAAMTSLDPVRSMAARLAGPFVSTGSHFDPLPDHEEMQQAGLAAVIYPREGWRFGVVEIARFLGRLRRDPDASVRDYHERAVNHPLGSMAGWHAFAGFPEGLEFLERHSAPAPTPGAGWRPPQS